MRIAVLGANAPLGGLIVEQAEAVGIGVLSVVENAASLTGDGPLLIKSYQDLSAEDLQDLHYVVDATSFPQVKRYSSELLPLWHLCELLKDQALPLLVIGSCSCLYTDKSRSTYVLDSQLLCHDDKSVYLRLCLNAFKRLKENRDVNWTMLCPPLLLDLQGPGGKELEFTEEVLPMGLDGGSCISVRDFAKAAVETLLRGLKSRQVLAVRGC
ncbi:MAG: hypothetical protein IJ228_03530 [Succinivibrio sp.]|nr:hypothetical protein [Succinivibrio sp.]